MRDVITLWKEGSNAGPLREVQSIRQKVKNISMVVVAENQSQFLLCFTEVKWVVNSIVAGRFTVWHTCIQNVSQSLCCIVRVRVVLSYDRWSCCVFDWQVGDVPSGSCLLYLIYSFLSSVCLWLSEDPEGQLSVRRRRPGG